MESFHTEHDEEATRLRMAMVDGLKNRGLIQTKSVEEAFRSVPREFFVPGIDVQQANTDVPIVTREQNGRPISSSSAPSVMAIMLEMLNLRPGQRVLEIGAGTGYNAALMGYIVGETGWVVTIDIDEDIVQDARRHLQEADSKNVQAICADGSLGYAQEAPYDCVILTVAAVDIAPAWFEQLLPGGRIVLPFQLASFESKLAAFSLLPDQLLIAFQKTGAGLECLDLRPCGFITLRGNLASEGTKVCVDAPESGLSALLSPDIRARRIFRALRGIYRDEEADVYLALNELYGLRFWLILRDQRFCEIYVQLGTDIGAIPVRQLGPNMSFQAALGLCEKSTCCLLSLHEDESDPPVVPGHPFRLAIRQFGKDHSLSERLRAEARAWFQAGRPFTWDIEGRMKSVHVRALPVAMSYTPEPLEASFSRKYTRFIFAPKVASALSPSIENET